VGDSTSWQDGLSRAREANQVDSWLAAEGIDVVHLGIYDNSGTLREKRLPARAAAEAIECGWSFIDAIQYWDPSDTTFVDSGATSEAAAVDLDSGRRYPFEPSAAAFVADFTGASAALSPRRQLIKLVERAATLGLHARVGWEFECIVLDQDARSLSTSEQLVPTEPANRCWSALTPAVEAEMLTALSATLAAGDVPLHHTCSELGPGCLELAFRAGPIVRAADDAACAKLYTKAFFARRGQTATFMAQLADGFPGLGGHPSLSLWDDDGRPALSETDGELAKLGRSAIAGIVRLMPELLVMAASTVNAYRRYAPGNWAPRSATWGPGNYTCGVRHVVGRPEDARLELRIPGADTSTHLCSAMLLGAVVWGIEQAWDPPDPILPPANGRDVVDREIGALPRTLLEGAERFADSETARELFGPVFVDHFAASRVAEDEACRRFVSAQERTRYLHQV